MATRTLHIDQLLPRPREEVFAFFADVANLEQITPPWLNFETVTPQPIAMAPGAMIEHRLRLRGVPMRWRTRIAVWDPPHRFVDEQLKGPYRLWRHEHRFEEVAGSTKVVDHVEYRAPGGPLEPMIHALFVRPEVERIFAWRHKILAQTFGGGEPGPSTQRQAPTPA